VQVDIARQRLALDMHLEDFLPSAQIGAIQHDAAVEAARAHQGRVEDVRAVRRRQDDDLGVGVETVHLHQDLVQRLLALIVAAAQPRPALPPHGIDLIDEDDARRVALRLLEQVAHARRTHAHEHLDELRAGNGEEGHAGLPGDRLGHQRLARAGRPHQQHTLRNARPERGELLRLLEKFDDLLQLLLGLVRTGHVCKGHGGLVAREHARLALAEAEGLVARTLRLPHQEDEEAGQEQYRHD